ERIERRGQQRTQEDAEDGPAAARHHLPVIPEVRLLFDRHAVQRLRLGQHRHTAMHHFEARLGRRQSPGIASRIVEGAHRGKLIPMPNLKKSRTPYSTAFPADLPTITTSFACRSPTVLPCSTSPRFAPVAELAATRRTT